VGQRWSLRARFVLVAAACLLPLLGVVVFILQQSLGNGRTQVLDAQRAAAEVVAQVLGSTLHDNEQVLQELSSEPAVQRLDPAASTAVLGVFRRARPNSVYGLFLIGNDQRIIATAGLEPPLPSGLGSTLDRALGPGTVAVSSKVAVPGKDDVVAIVAPVWAEDRAKGQPVGAVGALLSVEQLQAAVLPFARGDTVIAIVAGQDIIATRAADDELSQEDLTNRLAEPIAKAAAGTIGTVAYEDEKGNGRLAAYAPVDVPGAAWAVFVTQPSPTTYAPNQSLLERALAALALATLVALVLAVGLGEWIARPLRLLTEQAVALTRGDFSHRAPPVSGGEIGALSVAFREMADRFATQVGDLEVAREEGAAWAEQLRELHRRTIRLQEDERRRIASDIHDAVAPLITGALYQARAVRLSSDRATPPPVAEGLDAVGDLLARAMTELHDVIFALRPPDLDDLGVVAAIERYVGQVQRAGLHGRLEVIGDAPPLTPEVRLAIYRIVQEALHNALRHAAADEATVRFETTEGLLRVTIHDNGAGFDPERATRPSALGLLSMRERATAIGASFAITSRPGDGTTVLIERRLEAEAIPEREEPTILVTAVDPAANGARSSTRPVATRVESA